MTVLLDTGVIFAFLNADDVRNEQACELITRIGDRHFGEPLVNDHVIDELFVLIRTRTRSAKLEEAAKKFLPMPSPILRGLRLVSLGTELIPPAWEVFRRYRDQGLSFTDAGLIVTMDELKIDFLATFDDALSRLVRVAR